MAADPFDKTAESDQTVESESGRANETSTASLDALQKYAQAQFSLGTEIGRGGLGRVLRARDPIFDRPIAIKELLSNQADARARFLREAMITARLQHPSIIPIYLAGTWADGAPFYAMKLVDGAPLSELFRKRTNLAERIALLPNVIAACDAIAFAHRAQILHRDLKPHNILVGELGETVVIDWGLAKDLAATTDDARDDKHYQAAIRATETVDGAVLGTPAYMPPEQAKGEDVDERADVYSLGSILYELLAGVPPYAEQRNARDLLDRLETGPPKPILERTPTAPRDLIAIAERAMARDRDQRYPDALALVADLKRFQAGQLVSVQTYSLADRIARWVKRHRAAVAVAGVATIALAAVGVYSILQVVEARDSALHSARVAESERANAEQRSELLLLERARTLARTDPTQAIATLAMLAPGSRAWASVRLIAAEAESFGIATLLPTPVRSSFIELDSSDTFLFAVAPGRSVAYTLADNQPRELETPGLAAIVAGAAILSHGKTKAWLTDARTGAKRELEVGTKIEDVVAAPDGSHIALQTKAECIVWQPATDVRRSIALEGSPLAISNAGLLVIDGGTEIVVVGRDERRFSKPSAGKPVAARNASLVAVPADKQISVLDVALGTWTTLDAPVEYRELVVAEDGTSLHAIGRDIVVEWKRSTGGSWSTPLQYDRSRPGAESEPSWIANGIAYRLSNSRQWHRFEHPSRLRHRTMTKDGKWTFARLPDGTLRRWSLADRAAHQCPDQRVIGIAGRRVVMNGAGTDIILCDPRDGAQRTLSGARFAPTSIGASSSGQTMVSHSREETLLWNLDTGVHRSISPLKTRELTDHRIVGLRDGALVTVDVATLDTKQHCAGAEVPDWPHIGTKLVAWIGKQGLATCNLTTNELLVLDATPATFPPYLALALDDSALVASIGKDVFYWNLSTRARTQLPIATSKELFLAFSRDGARIVAANESEVLVLDPTLKPLSRFAIQDPSLLPIYVDDTKETWTHRAVALSPDGRQLAISSSGSDLLLFDLDLGGPRKIGGTSGQLLWAAFVEDGLVVFDYTTLRTQRPFFVRDDLPREPRALEAWVRGATNAKLDGGRLVPR